MTWIKTISYDQSEGPLRRIYNRIKGPDNYIDNILQAHSLRPASLEGHMKLYKNVLHHRQNTLDKWLLETLGVYVSLLNACTYCVEHHFAGLKKLLQDDPRALQIRKALEQGQPAEVFSGAELALMKYAHALTVHPADMQVAEVELLRKAGLDDGAILEANQVISYFAYANRTVLGLGVHTDGDVLGLSPGSGEEQDWAHG